jgi:hypothetical protein
VTLRRGQFTAGRVPGQSPGTQAIKVASRALPDSNPKSAHGIKKPSTFCIPPAAILHLGLVMTHGADKYGRFNWRDNSVAISVYLDAINRHFLAVVDGHDIDTGTEEVPGSGLENLAHVMACCAIILDAREQGSLIDDRIGKPGLIEQTLQRMTKV